MIRRIGRKTIRDTTMFGGGTRGATRDRRRGRIVGGRIRHIFGALFGVTFACAVCVASSWTGVHASQDAGTGDELAEYVRAHYTKYEYRIPMRDGVRLFTSVYVPNDRDTTHPILMLRTPYSVAPYGADTYRKRLGPGPEYAEEGFIFVYQDVRGKSMSEGKFVNMRPHVADKRAGADGPRPVDESTDTYDTIAWLLEHVPGHNGKVGMWGVSYPGFYVAAGMIDSHPALRAASPQAPIADWFFDDFHRNGAFILPMAFNFFSSFGRPRPEPTTDPVPRFDHGTPDGYGFFLRLGPLANVNAKYFHGEIPFWNDIVAHPNCDAYWQARSIVPHLTGITAAVLTVGGWYDTEDLYGPLAIYRSVEERNRKTANTLVMGPWRHGGWARTTGRELGEADFGFATSPDYRERIELPFFLHHLKDGPDPKLPEAFVFETGANRWREFDAWPPGESVPAAIELGPGGTAQVSADSSAREGSHVSGSGDGDGATATTPDARSSNVGDAGASAGLTGNAEDAGSSAAFSEFVSDPAKPVPYTMEITAGWARDYMTEDQRFAAWRPDVLVFATGPLEDDVTLAGPLDIDLHVSTTGRDADWVVKLIDVYPEEEPRFVERRRGGSNDEVDRGGTQRLVRAQVLRGRFRESFEHPVPFEPGAITRVRFEAQDVLHTFARGHRIMIHVQSTWFPFVDRNPQSWVPNIFEARDEDFVRATHRVYHTPEHPSRVRVRVLPRKGG